MCLLVRLCVHDGCVCVCEFVYECANECECVRVCVCVCVCIWADGRLVACSGSAVVSQARPRTTLSEYSSTPSRPERTRACVCRLCVCVCVFV